MIVSDITELVLVDSFDRGVPNLERIVFRVAAQSLNLGQYGLMLGIKANAGAAHPIRDNFLWFGDAILAKDDWIFVYTGEGTPSVNDLPNGRGRLISVFWGRKLTLLHDPNIVPILMRVDAVIVGS